MFIILFLCFFFWANKNDNFLVISLL